MSNELKKWFIIFIVVLSSFFAGVGLGILNAPQKPIDQKAIKMIIEPNIAQETIQNFIRAYYTDDNALHPNKMKEYVTTGFLKQLNEYAKSLDESNYFTSLKSAKVKNIKLYFGQSNDEVICTADIQKVYTRDQSKDSKEIQVTDHQSVLLQYKIRDKDKVEVDNLTTIYLQDIKEGETAYGKED